MGLQKCVWLVKLVGLELCVGLECLWGLRSVWDWDLVGLQHCVGKGRCLSPKATHHSAALNRHLLLVCCWLCEHTALQ